MYICDSNVVVAGISSTVEDNADTPEVRAQTLAALRQITNRFNKIPLEKLDRAFVAVSHNQTHPPAP